MHHEINLIWAEGLNHVIGVNNTLPWHLPEDLQHFKELTTGQTVVMGRNTWDSLPERFRPLPGRVNIVITRSPESFEGVSGVLAYSSIDKLLEEHAEPLWVIGGSQIYHAFMPLATGLYVTKIDMLVPNGDAYAPEIDDDLFNPIRVGERSVSKSGIPYYFVTYASAVN